MKKGLFLGALASVMLLATSCQEDFPALNAGSEVTVSFNVETPQVDTRAYSDGLSATKLQYAVYEVVDSETKELQHLKALDGTANFDGKSRTTTIQLQLTKGLTYTVVFWAQNPDAKLYTVNFDETTASVEVNYDDENLVVCNNEDLDAFFGDETFTVEGSKSQNVTLNRPFAQLNIGTSDYDQAVAAGYTVANSAVTVSAKVYSEFSLVGDHKVLGEPRAVSFTSAPIPAEGEAFPVDPDNNKYLAMNYILVGAEEALIPQVTFTYSEAEGANEQKRTYGQIPVRRNYRTNIYGQLLTNNLDVNVTIDEWYVNDDKYGEEDGKTYIRVSTPEEFNDAFNSKDDEGKLVYDKIIVEENLVLGADLTRAEGADPHYLVENDLIIDLGDKIITATSANTGKNVNWFDVQEGATLTVENGTMEYTHKGDNMGWSNSTNLFNVTEGGVLNLKDVTAKNLGGSDMAFVVHLNNWGEVTLNVEDCTLESTYMAVRVFNSGPDMNNVNIKYSTLKGNKYAFWVHNYTVEDFGGNEAKAEAQKKLLNLNIFNQGNTFSPDANGILFGFTNGIACDAYGITRKVSEDGSVVTLGSIVEKGLVRRGVAGTEGNETIKEVIVEEGVAVLYDRTFRRFYALEKVTLPNTLTTIGEAGTGVFQSCAKLTEVVIPESVTILGNGTFYGCTSLVSVNVPTGVTRIEENVFRETAIKTIEFHENVTYFGSNAFRDCDALEEITIKAPVFEVESNTFLNATTPYPALTIYVANAEMQAYLAAKVPSHITVVGPTSVRTAEELETALKNGDDVVLQNDLKDVAVNNTAPYGNSYGVALNGGTLDGNGHVLDFKSSGDNYGIMTTGGTIKNATITGVFRAIMIMNPTETLYVDNVTIGDEDVCYAINTGEGDGTQSVVVTNSTIKGWSSYGNAIKDVTFTDCTFAQGSYYTNVYGRLVKPYVDAVFDGCEFNSKFYIDLSALSTDGDGNVVNPNAKITLKNCTVNGVRLTKDNWTSLVAPEESCGEGQISIELKDGTYLTANNVVDYVIFE